MGNTSSNSRPGSSLISNANGYNSDPRNNLNDLYNPSTLSLHGPPPPPVANTYVLRNGRYESQSTWPSLSFAGFDGGGGGGGLGGGNNGVFSFFGGGGNGNGNNGGNGTLGNAISNTMNLHNRLYRPLHPPDLKKTKLIKSPFHLKRTHIRSRIEKESGYLWVAVGFDAGVNCILEAECQTDTGIMKSCKERRNKGMKQSFKFIASKVMENVNTVTICIKITRDLDYGSKNNKYGITTSTESDSESNAAGVGSGGGQERLLYSPAPMKGGVMSPIHNSNPLNGNVPSLGPVSDDQLITGQISEIVINRPNGTSNGKGPSESLGDLDWIPELRHQVMQFRDTCWDLQEVYGVSRNAWGIPPSVSKEAGVNSSSKGSKGSGPDNNVVAKISESKSSDHDGNVEGDSGTKIKSESNSKTSNADSKAESDADITKSKIKSESESTVKLECKEVIPNSNTHSIVQGTRALSKNSDSAASVCPSTFSQTLSLNHINNNNNFENEGNTDCIICLSEPRDTLVLPCRHMSFCSGCAGIMRYQCDRCPICRQGVTSLLQFQREE